MSKLDAENYKSASAAKQRADEAFLKANPDFEPDGDFYDAHSCGAFADSSGVCMWCGAIVSGTPAYYDAYGCDPPEQSGDPYRPPYKDY